MTFTPLDLLRRLASGILPDAGPRAQTPAPMDQAAFADLLSQVRDGTMESGQPVNVDAGAKVELTGEQMTRLGVALDAAEAAGHSRVLALIDGMTLTVDVPGRTVLESHSPGEARMLTDIDAVISVPALGAKELRSLFSAGGRAGASASPLAGLNLARNSSLTELLATNETGGAPDRNSSAADAA